MFDWLIRLDVNQIFSPEMPLLEILVRGTVVYLTLCLLLRIIPKRQAGEMSPNDMLLVVIVGGIAVCALTRDFMAIPDVLLLIATVMGWNFTLDWLAFRFPWLRPLLREPPTLLIQDGKYVPEGLRRELISKEDVRIELRKQGIASIEGIEKAYLEADGTISVIGNSDSNQTSPNVADTMQGQAVPAIDSGEAFPGSRDDAAEAAMNRFLDPERDLHWQLEWHGKQAAAHEERVKHLRELLREHSRRIPVSPQGQPGATVEDGAMKPHAERNGPSTPDS